MNGDVEELLRESMDQSTADMRVPADLLARARTRVRHRQLAVRAALACGTAAVTAAALVAVTIPGSGGATNAQTTAYVIKRVQNALAGANFVIQGRGTGTYTFPVHGHQVGGSNGQTNSWTYGNKTRTVQFTPAGRDCGQVLPNGDCTNRGGSERYWAQGTARIGGKLVSAYVTYYNHKYSLSPVGGSQANACSTTAQLVLGGPAVAMPDWPAFLKAMLACQHATVTGHARIGGRETIVIIGSVDVRLSKGYGRTVHAKRVRVRFTLYVDPATYLPVQMNGSTETYGGAAGPTVNSYMTAVRWLPPTAANIAKTLVTIPPGYTQVSSPAQQ